MLGELSAPQHTEKILAAWVVKPEKSETEKKQRHGLYQNKQQPYEELKVCDAPRHKKSCPKKVKVWDAPRHKKNCHEVGGCTKKVIYNGMYVHDSECVDSLILAHPWETNVLRSPSVKWRS